MSSGFKPVFGLSGPRDLMKLVEENYRELEAQPNERRLINCVVSAWHIQDWVRRALLGDSNNPEHGKRWSQLSGGTPKTPSEDEFKDWLKAECPASDILRQVTNHVKHLRKSDSRKELRGDPLTFNHEPVWSIVDIDSGKVLDVYCRLQSSGTALSDVIAFWTGFFAAHTDWQ